MWIGSTKKEPRHSSARVKENVGIGSKCGNRFWEVLWVFWRSLIAREQVKEQEFFELSTYAFPNLLLHPDLDFKRFEGSYVDVRGKLAKVLGALNDHFSTALTTHAGIPARVAAALGHLGINLSPESSGVQMINEYSDQYASVQSRLRKGEVNMVAMRFQLGMPLAPVGDAGEHDIRCAISFRLLRVSSSPITTSVQILVPTAPGATHRSKRAIKTCSPSSEPADNEGEHLLIMRIGVEWGGGGGRGERPRTSCDQR